MTRPAEDGLTPPAAKDRQASFLQQDDRVEDEQDRKKIVQRLRLRSTIDPPPSGPAPVPTPKAPDRPESFPECMSTRKMRMTAMTTWMTDRIVSTASDYISFELRCHA